MTASEYKTASREQIFTDAIRDNEKQILSVCRYYFGNNAEAQDVRQEVLLKVWLNISSFRGESQLKTWITRITVNTCLTCLAKSNRDFALFIRPGSLEAADIIDEEYDETLKEEMLQLFSDFTRSLNPFDKTLVALYLEEVPYIEIAQVTGLTEANARTRISRIKAQIQNNWRKRYEDKQQ